MPDQPYLGNSPISDSGLEESWRDALLDGCSIVPDPVIVGRRSMTPLMHRASTAEDNFFDIPL